MKDGISEIPEGSSARINSDLRLMELADRNPSLGGRELLREIIERGPMPEENERRQAIDIRAALRIPSIDDPNYRTQSEQADWIGKDSKIMRDLYERGAQIRGRVLIVPAEEHELNEDRGTPFITTISYALEKIDDVEKAAEFHSLAQKISGHTADDRTQLVVFRTFYGKIAASETDREEALSRTLEEMRRIAIEMEKLEPVESVEFIHQNESRNEGRGIEYRVASRTVRLTEEALRFPAGLTYETRARLVSVTIPEIDRRLEGGISKGNLFASIDRTMLHPDLRTKENDAKAKLSLTDREMDERGRIVGFLKNYIEERLRDPETRALNISPQFRLAREELINAKTLEDLWRAAENFLRINRRRSEELRLHSSDPDPIPRTTSLPLSVRERNLLFNGRAPDHHSCGMRELRINYGLSRLERSEKVEKLSRGLIEPSNSLRQMLDELETRKTAKAIGQFQASLFNPEMNSEGKQNLNTLYHRIPPHERTYLYQLSESRKYALQNTQHQNNQEKLHSPLDRGRLGEMPRESDSLRKYLSSMSQIERRLLNEEIRKHCVNLEVGQDRDGLTINEARSLLPERSAREIRLRARDLAWEKIVPGEVFEGNPLPEAARISDTIAHIHGHLQEKARIAQNARNDFLAEKIFEAERRVGVIDPKSDPQTKDSREKFIHSVVAGLSRDERQKLEALDIYAAQTREKVYRGFKEIDGQLRDLQQSRAQVETQKIELGDTVNHVNNASLKRSAVLVNPSHSFTHVSTTIFTPPGQREHNGRGEKILPIDININKEWHFDSLRDALKAERNGQGESEQEIVKYSDHIEDHKVDLHR